MKNTWKVVLDSEPYGREEFEVEPSSTSSLVTFHKLIDSAMREFKKDRITREISLVCTVRPRKV